jgi:hypothetical protein
MLLSSAQGDWDGGMFPLAPEVLEPIRRQLGVAHRVLDVLVAETVLQGSGIVPVVGELIAARMPQHVRMQLERHPGGLAKPLDEMVEADGAHAIADEVIRTLNGPDSGFIPMADKAFILIPRRKDNAMKFRQGKSACKSFSEGKARSWFRPCCCPIR